MLATALIILIAVTIFRVVNPPLREPKKSPSTEADVEGRSALAHGLCEDSEGVPPNWENNNTKMLFLQLT